MKDKCSNKVCRVLSHACPVFLFNLIFSLFVISFFSFNFILYYLPFSCLLLFGCLVREKIDETVLYFVLSSEMEITPTVFS